MRQTALVGAVFPRDGLLHTAFSAGLPGASPTAIVRFLAYLAAGFDPAEARNRVTGNTPLSAFDGRPAMERADVPNSIRDDIKARYPGKTISWVLRYQMALVNGANERQAESIANGFTAGRPKGSKDSKPRTRRSNAEVAAAREGAMT